MYNYKPRTAIVKGYEIRLFYINGGPNITFPSSRVAPYSMNKIPA